MANESKHAPRKSQASPNNPQQPRGDTAVAAVRHVGKTLESDPEYNDQPARAMAPEAGLLSRGGNDLSASPDMRAGSDPLNGTVMSSTGGRVEPLKTRLPGDTSSEPHTDVGPDNATTVQHRGEDKREVGGKRRRP